MTSATVGHTVSAVLTNRRAGTFDANLLLRATSTAATTAVVGTYAAPDWASSFVDLGDGAFFGRVVIHKFAPTLANADNTMRFVLMGADAAGTLTAPLGELQIGAAAALWGGSAAWGNAAFIETGDLSFCFNNVQQGLRFPQAKLLLINGGTASGFTSGTFGAFISRIN